MTDIHTETATSNGVLSSPRANPLIAVLDQRAFPTLKQPPSQHSRHWQRASLILALLALLSVAAACWYVTESHAVFTDDPNFDVGQADHSASVLGLAGNQLRTVREILFRPAPHQFQITYRQREDRAAADENDCWRTPSNIEPQHRKIGSR